MDSLREYRKKRPLGKSPEPRGGRATAQQNSFVIQRHDATRLHYDFRLEMSGILKSWAVPKGPSLDPSVKRLAVETEDHPLDYGGFEGQIPEGNYGAGEVILWDRGTYELEGPLSAEDQYKRGELKIILHGEKINGGFVLVKLKNSAAKKEWLLIKHRDAEVRQDWNIEDHGQSVKSGKLPGPPRHGKRSANATPLPTGAQNLANAKKAPMPTDVQPALASHGDSPSSGDDWLYEIKWDGIRVLSYLEGGKAKLIARSGRDISNEYPDLNDLAKYVRARTAILDGEIVVLDEKGKSDFQRLQARFGIKNPSLKVQQDAPPTMYFFDLLYCDGYDLRRTPLIERKELLSRIISVTPKVRVSTHHVGKGKELFEAALKNGLEGIIGKKTDSPYPAGRTSNWLKFKSVLEMDAVIGGWTDPRGSRQRFGSLLLGLYKGASLHFIGGVGAGFSQKTEEEIFQKLQEIATERSPFAGKVDTREKAHWVKPVLIARVGYSEWTADQHLRQPRFMGLHPDRDPRECTFSDEKRAQEEKIQAKKSKPAKTTEKLAPRSRLDGQGIAEILENEKKEECRLTVDGKELKLTHLSKVYFPKDGFTKRQVLAYYARVSPYLLPFLEDRPLVLHRYPNGIGKEAFYQKDAGPTAPEWLRTADIYSETKKENVPYFMANDLASLLYLTNLGCIDHNPLPARYKSLEKPDYMFIDLDPTEGADFSRVVQAARVLGKVVEQARLKFFIKTSGATGLHLFIPIVPKYSFDQVRELLEIIGRVAMQNEKNLLTRQFRVQERPKNTVFFDVRQNAFGQSLASVFSIRPRDGAPVSMPIEWKELTPNLRPDKWKLNTVPKDLSKRAAIWKGFWSKQQTLEKALGWLERSNVG
ncbi:MAG TPA: DNA ligase D [Candidatus Dormibacteraeota bacterium]|nr:DNA ligase D [Candidatus Dormibacteraeota bacterium]